MKHKPEVKKVLVVLGAELARPEKPLQSALMQRAVALAKATGCQLDLFYPCYDGALDKNLFVADGDLERMRKRQMDEDATRLAELAAWIAKDGIRVQHEVRWDSPRTDTILRKVAETQPDLIMKVAREHGFVLGITSNTDWELARRSPVHIWFVSDEVENIDRIVAAVGHEFDSLDDVESSPDYALLQTVGMIGKSLDADVHAVNAYNAQSTTAFVGPAIGGTIAPVAPPDVERDELFERVVKRHRSSVHALAKSSDIPRDNVHICEGHPNQVIPEIAESISADMIAMGASNISRLERFLSSVTVEPVMSKANCDILVIRERDASRIPDAEKQPAIGKSRYDLDQAITHPEETFKSPDEVAKLVGVSVELRNRILQAWEYDIRAEMAEENEGGPVNNIDVAALDAIESAKEILKVERQQESTRHWPA